MFRGLRASRRLMSTLRGKYNGDLVPQYDELVSYCRRRGWIVASGGIYGGLSNQYDFGPLGSQLRKTLRDSWWADFVECRADVLGVETGVIQHPQVWKSSGHVDEFTDTLVECSNCNTRSRADHILNIDQGAGNADDLEQVQKWIDTRALCCPTCKKTDAFRNPHRFNLLFKTNWGPVEDTAGNVYLRPETAQAAFILYPEVQQVCRRNRDLPIGIAQVGRAFRNEISPGHFMFRTREFEQMELEYFVKPESAMEHYTQWVSYCNDWLRKYGVRTELLRSCEFTKSDDLAHYAKACTDIEFKFPHGWGELWGIANRGDFDLKQHAKGAGVDLRETGNPGSKEEPFFPYVIEPSVGLDRLMLAVLTSAYDVESVVGANGKETERTVLRLNKDLAPIQFGIFPLMRKSGEQVGFARDLEQRLRGLRYRVEYDETGSIGKRYRRYDEIGTPFCITIDQQSLEDQSVTVRYRDTMQQDRVPVTSLLSRDWFARL